MAHIAFVKSVLSKAVLNNQPKCIAFHLNKNPDSKINIDMNTGAVKVGVKQINGFNALEYAIYSTEERGEP